MNDSAFVTEVVDLITAYFRREIGRLMHQAEHWAKHDKPLAVHHRVTKADAYYQVVSLFERHGKFDQDVFAIMRDEVNRQDIFAPGAYPPSAYIHRYRNPTFVCEMLSGEQHAAPAEVYVPGRWRCPKCKFVLSQFNLNANDGSVSTRDEAGDKCPNCDKPLWRVTWKEDAMEMAERALEQVQRAVKKEGEALLLRTALQGMVDSFKPFTLKPVGAPGSSARAEQDGQITAHAAAIEALNSGAGA